MPMTDDGPCFFCGKTLIEMDGIYVCHNEGGCGAYERFKVKDQVMTEQLEWVVPQQVILDLYKAGKLFNKKLTCGHWNKDWKAGKGGRITWCKCRDCNQELIVPPSIREEKK